MTVAGHAELHPVGDAGGDLDRHGRGSADPPPAEAVPARVGDLLPGPVARAARRGGHQRAEDAPPDGLHLTGAAARPAGDRRGPRLGTVAEAALARLEPLELDLPTDAERRLLEGEPDDHAHVLAVPGARPRTSPARPEPAEPALPEEQVEDVGDVGERLAARSGRPERVVPRALLRIGEDLVGAGDLLEPLLRLRVGAHVRVELAREPAVRLADVLVRRVPWNAEHLVEIARDGHAYCSSSVAASDSRSATARTDAIADR